ncbi:MAG: hypothetical protein KF784_02330 [Fimbriimonadaceae bacterium]|nr:hypothetical protein [Fimbriimonadaceae bacterium]
MKTERYSDAESVEGALFGQAVIDKQPHDLDEDQMVELLVKLAPVVNSYGIGQVTRAMKIFCCSSARLLEEQDAETEPQVAMMLAVEGFEAIEELLEPFKVAFLSREIEG